jgi:hypothetical protein
MTGEAQGTDRPDGPPFASTRWSEPEAPGEPGPAPPYVPGRERGARPDQADTHDTAFPFELPHDGVAAGGGEDPVLDVADRLESLAGRLRSEGPAAVEREMASLDRLTALVAGLVSGYLAGLRG